MLRARTQADRGGARIVIGCYLMADGLFPQRLHTGAADPFSQPVGTHPGLAGLIANRFRRALPPGSRLPPGMRRVDRARANCRPAAACDRIPRRKAAGHRARR